jgi:antitoxin ParD1/3/4
VVQEALRLLEAAERIRAQRLRDVKAKIAEGLASLNRGEGLDGEEVFGELDAAISGHRGKKSRR